MTARLHATSNDYSDDSSIERKLTELDDDDDLAPKWFKQLSSITPLVMPLSRFISFNHPTNAKKQVVCIYQNKKQPH